MGQLFTTHGLARWLAFLVGWAALGRVQPHDLAAGVVIAGLAAGLSLHLLPPGRGWPSLPAAGTYAARFVLGSLLAGWDVALRVAATPPRIRPGVLAVPCPVPDGAPRDAFRALASLQPGTLPLADAGADLMVHCLDTDAPVAQALEADAAAFLAIAGERRDG